MRISKKNLKQILLTIVVGFSVATAQAATITRGASGHDVKRVQNYLIHQGYLIDKADGILGNNTAYAVKAFQKDMGLEITGNVDEETLAKLKENDLRFVKVDSSDTKALEVKKQKTLSINKYPDMHLKKGDSATQVHKAQVLLVKTNYLNDKADGVFGSKTENAVKAFQKDQGLKETGIIDGETFTHLENYFQEQQASSKAKNEKEVIVKKETVEEEKEFTSLIKVRKEGEDENKHSKSKKVFVRGDKHADISKLQEKLSVNGYSTNGIEGTFGAGTEKAVKAFQRDNSLKVTGKIDSKTRTEIEKLRLKPKKYSRKMEVEATAYTSGVGGVGNYTSQGHKLRRGYIAVDPNVIPMGTEVFIEGYGFAIADDIGGAIKGNKIDVAVDSKEEAMQYGRQKTTLYIL